MSEQPMKVRLASISNTACLSATPDALRVIALVSM
jgi:hypothetical protein